LTSRAQGLPGDVAALGELSRLYHANGFSREAALAYEGLLRFDARNPRWPHLLAHILAGTGQLARAAPLWRKVTELAPDYVPARLRLGEALLKTNEPALAAETYAAALRLVPDDPYALFGLARCELQQERWTAARERLQQAA
jgi:tetratricopeptide (TPR) repeat protein